MAGIWLSYNRHVTVRNYSNTTVATTLDGSVTDSATAWTVDDGSTYPAVPFAAVCESEVVLVTAKSGTNDVNWTVLRGFDGTTAAAHSDAAAVAHAAIAADFERVQPSGNWCLIEEIEVTADSAPIEFNNIPQTYKHLRIMGRIKGDDIGGTPELNAAAMRFGTGGTLDSGANYTYQRPGGGDLANANLEAATEFQIIIAADAGGVPADHFSRFDLTIYDYYRAEPRSFLEMHGGTDRTAYTWTNHGYGEWNSSAQLDDIAFWGDSSLGNVLAGTRLSLYGWQDGVVVSDTAEVFIGETTLSGTSTDIDLPAGYDGFRFEAYLASSTGTPTFDVRFGAGSIDTGANYDDAYKYWGDSEGQSSNDGGTSIRLNSNNYVADEPDVSTGWILPGYDDASQATFLFADGLILGGTRQFGYNTRGKYTVDAAVDKMQILVSSGNFGAGSKLLLYGKRRALVGAAAAVSEEVSAGVSGNWVLIEEIVLSADAATITFNDIPQTYRHLQMMGRLRSDEASAWDTGRIRFGTGGTIDTAASYSLAHNQFGDGSPAATNENQNQFNLYGVAAASATADYFSDLKANVWHYTEDHPGLAYWSEGANSPAGGGTRGDRFAGRWEGTTAVDDIEFSFPDAAEFIAGSRVALYGWQDGAPNTPYTRKWGTFEAEVTADSPVGWLKLDETSGTTAVDSIDATNNGTYSGSPTLNQAAPFQLGGASVDFDGTDDYVEWDAIGDHLTAEYTFETWCRTDDITTGQAIFGINTSTGTNRMVLYFSDPSDLDGELRINGSGTGFSSRAPLIGENVWNHIVATHKNGTTLIYVNGKAVFGKDEAATITGTDTIQLGMEYDSGPTATDYFDGSFAHFVAYDTALSPDRINTHYLAGVYGSDDALAGVQPNPLWVQHLADRTVDLTESAHEDDDEFDDGVLDASWTLVEDQASAQVITEARGLLSIKMDTTFGAGDGNGIVKAIPSGATTIQIDMCQRMLGNAANGRGYAMFGPCFTDGATAASNIRYLMAYCLDATERVIINPCHGTFGTITTNAGPSYNPPMGSLYLRIVLTVSTGQVQWAASPDGVSYTDLANLSTTLSGVSHMGMMWTGWDDSLTSADPAFVTAEYFRVKVT